MSKALKIGVDVGGTKIAAGLVTANGKIIKRYLLPTEAKGKNVDILANIHKAIAAVWDTQVIGIGIGFAGLIDHQTGIIVRGPNFPKNFQGIKLAKLTSAAFSVPVSIDNDARCFTLGEAVFGLGKGKKSVFGITLGTGIGGGLVIFGEPWRGLNLAAGEVGHMTIAADSNLKCSCGKYGHLEALAAGPAIRRRYHQLTKRQLIPTDIQKLAARGDQAAKRTIDECGRYLGLGLANIIQTINPDVIVVGGGVSHDTRLLTQAIKSCYATVPHAEMKKTPILRSRLGGDAMILGAANLIE